MNKDNSNKAQAGAFSKSSLKEQLIYLKEKGYITSFKASKFNYPKKRKGQFKCDYLIEFPSSEKWILFSPNSLSSDRLKTKQWDAENIKKIDDSIKKAYIVCPDSAKASPKKNSDILRYRGYIRQGLDFSLVDDILYQSEFVSLVESTNLGSTLGGSKAAKLGLNFESLLKRILEDKQNLMRWQGNKNAAGNQYDIFESVMNALNIKPDTVQELKADDDIPDLPVYHYNDGSTKDGGRPKTDVVLIVTFKNKEQYEYTFSCKNTTKSDVTVFQFPPKYCVEILGIKESDTEQLLREFVASGGPTNMPKDRAELLTKRLAAYLDSFNRWVLHGTDKDGSTPRQRADYIITRYQRKSGKTTLKVETIDECIATQKALGKGHFGTIFKWTVTSTKFRADGTARPKEPVMRIVAK